MPSASVDDGWWLAEARMVEVMVFAVRTLEPLLTAKVPWDFQYLRKRKVSIVGRARTAQAGNMVVSTERFQIYERERRGEESRREDKMEWAVGNGVQSSNGNGVELRQSVAEE